MKWSVRLFTVKGVTLWLHITLLLFVAWLLVLFVSTGMQGQQLVWSFLFLAGLLGSILLHEYGHAIVAAQYGINAKNITLYPVGGIASLEKLPEHPRQELLISAAGPVVNFVIAALCWLFSSQQTYSESYAAFTGEINSTNFFSLLGMANLSLAVFNLIPAFPLDGGRLLRALLAFWFNYIKASSIVAVISKAVAAFFIVYGLGTLSFLFSLFGFFILIFSQAEEAYLQLKKLVEGYTVKDMLMYDYDSMDAGLTVQEVIPILQNNHHKYFILMENGQPVGTLDRMAVIKALASQKYGDSIAALMKENLVPLEADVPISTVLQLLAANEEKLYPVMDDGIFIGVINFRCVIEYIFLHSTQTRDFAKTKSLVELV